MVTCLYIDVREPADAVALDRLLRENGFRWLDVTGSDDAARQSQTLEDVASIYGVELEEKHYGK